MLAHLRNNYIFAHSTLNSIKDFIIITYFDVLNEEDLQRLMSMTMYMTVMKNVGMAKDVMKKLIWKASKL